MKTRQEEKDGKLIVMLEGDMNISEAAAIRDEWIGCLDAHDNLVFDLSNVSDCDTAGVQLLCSTCKTAEIMKKVFSIIRASDPVINAIKRIGLEPDEMMMLNKG